MTPLPATILLYLLALPTALLATTTTTTSSTSSPQPPLQTATLHYLPVAPAPSKPRPLALLTYSPHHPHLSSLVSFTPPANNASDADDALTSVLVYLDGQAEGGERYRSSVTATRGFHAPYTGRFRVVLDTRGEVVAASWRARLSKGSAAAAAAVGKRKGESGDRRGDFDIVATKLAPRVAFDKPAKGKGAATGASPGAGAAGAEGEGEEVEKTMLQKYWWVLLGVAVLAMAGGGDK